MRKNETVTTPFGKIAKWKDCERCGDKWACRFERVAYSQPCNKCKGTIEYEKEMADAILEDKKLGVGEVFRNREVKAVFTGYGRNFYTNSKGNIVKDEPYKPLK